MDYQAKVQVKKLSLDGKKIFVTFRFAETETVCDVRFVKLLIPKSSTTLDAFVLLAESAFGDSLVSTAQFNFLSQHSKESFIVTFDVQLSTEGTPVKGPYPVKKLELIYG